MHGSPFVSTQPCHAQANLLRDLIMVDVPPSRSVLCPRDGRPCIMKDDLDLEAKVRGEERQARPVWWKDHRQLIKKDVEAKETKDLEEKIANIFQNKRARVSLKKLGQSI